MSNEITISGAITLKSGLLNTGISRSSYKLNQNYSSPKTIAKTITVEDVEEALDKGEVSVLGYSYFRNLSNEETDVIYWGVMSGGDFYPFGKLYGGEAAMVRLSDTLTDIYVKAGNGQSIDLFYWINDD